MLRRLGEVLGFLTPETTRAADEAEFQMLRDRILKMDEIVADLQERLTNATALQASLIADRDALLVRLCRRIERK